jgi:3-phosphoshikimate 1-carboxyvinyltransferase
LIAGLYAEGKTEVIEPAKSRDHTERMLKAFGANVEVDGLKVGVEPTDEINVDDFSVPGDISSASFFITLGVLAKDSVLKIKDVGLNPTRLGFVKKLQEAGAKIELVQRVSEEESPIGEPLGDIIVRSSDLKAFVVKEEEIPSLIDELPLLFLIGCFAQGRSYIRGASELRVKETDRINSTFTNLRAMGAKIEIEGDDVIINGPTKLKGANLKSFFDHRTAMCAIIASLLAEGDSWIDDVDCISISFPNFINDLKGLIGDGVEFVK